MTMNRGQKPRLSSQSPEVSALVEQVSLAPAVADVAAQSEGVTLRIPSLNKPERQTRGRTREKGVC